MAYSLDNGSVLGSLESPSWGREPDLFKVQPYWIVQNRLNGTPNSELTHHCWQCGWEDADTEVLEGDRHKRPVEEEREDDFVSTLGLLSDAGGDARVNGIPFDEVRTESWKEGWVAADIQQA
jgi:hypothetical protein